MSQMDEPFLEAFRALQPDVDLVVLPPDEPVDAPPGDRVAEERATSSAVDALLAETHLERLPRERFDRWDRRGTDAHVHVSRVRVRHDDEASATTSLMSVGDVLDGAGWRPEPVDGPTPWLRAASPGGLAADVAVEVADLVITVTGAPVRLEDDPA